MTRRCRYTYVAPEYALVEPALTMDWISRREVFNIAATLAPSERVLPAALPLSPTPPLTTFAAAPIETHTPFNTLLLIFLGILALIPILCACLAVLMLAPGLSQTRQMIAAANVPAPEVTQTIDVASVISLTLTTTGTISNSPGQPSGPGVPHTATPGVQPQITGTVGARPGITPGTPLKSPLATPTALAARPGVTVIAATSTPFNTLQTPSVNRTATPFLPPTFTPIPIQTAVVSTPPPGITGTVSVTPTSTPVLIIVVTATITPLPSPTPTPNGLPVVVISSSVVISNVMYAGTPALNMSDQYIEVQNRGSGGVSIGNWRVHAESANLDFYFTNGLVLLPGQTCRVYGSSAPANTSSCGSFSFNSGTPVWSSVVDAAYLYDEKGELVGSYTYNTQR